MEDGDIQIRDLWEAISRLADLAGSEGDRGCEAIQNCYPMLSHHTPHATPPILKGWHHAATDRGSHVAGWGRERRARAEGGESDGVAAMPLVVQLRVCDANLKADTAVRNAACFQQRRIPRSLYYRISMERGGERGGQSERWRSGNVVGALHRGWVKPQVPVMCR